MQIATTLKTQSKRHPAEYIRPETGETLASEAKDGMTITLKESTNFFVIDTDDYVIFDAGAMAYLKNELNRADGDRVIDMAFMLKTDFCVISMNNNHPHTAATLSASLRMDKNKLYILIRKLVKKGILAYCVCAPSGYVRKIYMLNPWICRKRKNINIELKHIFSDVTKPVVERIKIAA